MRRNVGNGSDIRHCGSVIEGKEGRKKGRGKESEVVLATPDNRPNDNHISHLHYLQHPLFQMNTPLKKRRKKKTSNTFSFSTDPFTVKLIYIGTVN